MTSGGGQFVIKRNELSSSLISSSLWAAGWWKQMFLHNYSFLLAMLSLLLLWSAPGAFDSSAMTFWSLRRQLWPAVLSLCHVSAWRGGLSAWLLIVCILSQSISINMKNHFCQGFVICFGLRLVVKCFLSPACLPLCASGGAVYTLLWNIIVNREVYDKTFTWIELRSHTTKPLFCKVYFLAAG